MKTDGVNHLSPDFLAKEQAHEENTVPSKGFKNGQTVEKSAYVPHPPEGEKPPETTRIKNRRIKAVRYSETVSSRNRQDNNKEQTDSEGKKQVVGRTVNAVENSDKASDAGVLIPKVLKDHLAKLSSLVLPENKDAKHALVNADLVLHVEGKNQKKPSADVADKLAHKVAIASAQESEASLERFNKLLRTVASQPEITLKAVIEAHFNNHLSDSHDIDELNNKLSALVLRCQRHSLDQEMMKITGDHDQVSAKEKINTRTRHSLLIAEIGRSFSESIAKENTYSEPEKMKIAQDISRLLNTLRPERLPDFSEKVRQYCFMPDK
ncbi:hypothetical protein CI610_02041 [invertebrate metagenome]|uniref:Uncharacterized protein n=1 Tax=invertebrate metagenome TaxID=1711999 RepID=A0A2H9T712_9ZZZZ